MTSLLPRRALYLLAEFCDLKLQGLTCRARTAKGKVCKHKRPNGELFCKQHSKMYSSKVAYLASLHNLRGSKMQFGECLAIFGEVVKTGNLRWASTPFVCPESPIKSFSPFDKACRTLSIKTSQINHHLAVTQEAVEVTGPVEGCHCSWCCQVRRNELVEEDDEIELFSGSR